MPTTATSATQTGTLQRSYQNADGSTTTLNGGSRAWRNNNPGNLKYDTQAEAIAAGAIGVDSNGFAIFPSYAAGSQALTNVLAGTYGNSTINSMMNNYAPAYENDTAAYQNFLNNYVGAPGSATINSLTPQQLQRLQNGIQLQEGWVPGSVSNPNGTMGAPPSPLSSLSPSDSDQLDLEPQP